MRAIIYSAGPSMRRWIASGLHEQHAKEPMRIGINDAFRTLPDRWCHWCASGDILAYRPSYTVNRPLVGFCCLTSEYLEEIASHGWGGVAITWGDLPALRRVHTPSWSIIAAIALADKLGARDIAIYGWDMAIGHTRSDGSVYDHERARKEMRELCEIKTAISGSITIVNTKEDA